MKGSTVYHIIVYLLILSCAKAQVYQEGIVYEQNIQAVKPLAGVSITVDDVRTASDSKGYFRLKFRDKTEGDHLKFNINKPGYEVVNTFVIGRATLSKQGIEIVMCKAGQINENKIAYYNVSTKAIERKFEIERTRIITKYKNDSLQARAEIAQLKLERDNAMLLAPVIAEEFARTNFATASIVKKEAFTEFKRGNVSQALKILEAEDSKTKLTANLHPQAQRQQLLKAQIDNVVFQGQLYFLNLQLDSAESCYELAIHADSTNFKHLRDYSLLLTTFHRYDKAKKWWKKTYQKAGDQDKTNALIKLTQIYEVTLEFDTAFKYSQLARDISHGLYKFDSVAYASDYMVSLNNLGISYRHQNQTKESIKCLYEATKVYARHFSGESDTSVFDVSFICQILGNLGTAYKMDNNFDSSDYYFNSARRCFRALMEKAPRYIEEYARTLSFLGALHQEFSRLKSSTSYYKESLFIVERLFKANSIVYAPEMAILYHNLGNLYSSQDSLFQSLSYYNKALDLRIYLEISNPHIYRDRIAQILNNRGLLYLKLEDYVSALIDIRKAKEMFQNLSDEFPENFLNNYCKCLGDLGLAYPRALSSKAKNYYLQAIECYSKMKDTSIYGRTLARIYGNLAIIYAENVEFEQAIEIFNKSAYIYTWLANGISKEFYRDYVIIQTMIIETYYRWYYLEKDAKFKAKCLELITWLETFVLEKDIKLNLNNLQEIKKQLTN